MISKTGCRSQLPRGLIHASAAARLLGLRVRILPGARKTFSCECCVLSDRGLCVGLITRPEESYLLWCVVFWSWKLDEETLAHEVLSYHDTKKCGIIGGIMLAGFSCLSETVCFEQCNGSSDSVNWGTLLYELITVICLTMTAHWRR
jgi:hypothetical protein